MADVEKTVTLRGKTAGIDEAIRALGQFKEGYNGVTVASEKTERATLSYERELDRLQKRYDATYRASTALASAEKTLNAARSQGLIGAEREAQLMGLVASRYGEATVSAGAFARARAGLSSAVSVLGGVGGLAGLAGFFGVTALIHNTSETLSFASATVKLADRLGFTTKQLQELQHASALADTDITTLGNALEVFSRSIGMAAKGSGDLFDTLTRMGVPLRDQNGQLRSNFAILMDFADGLQRMRSESTKAAAVTAAFSRAGAGMTTVLAGGSGALRDAAEQADRFGTVVDDRLLRAGEQLGDQWTTASRVIGGVFKRALLGAVADAEDAAGIFEGIYRKWASRDTAASAVSSLEKQIADIQRVIDGNPSMQLTVRLSYQSDIAGLQAQLSAARAGLVDTGGAGSPRTTSALLSAIGLPATVVGGDHGSTSRLPGEKPPGTGLGAGLSSSAINLVPAIDRTGSAIDRLNDRLTTTRDLVGGFASSFIEAKRSGEGFADSLKSAVGSLADRLTDLAVNRGLDALFALVGGGGLFGGGGYSGFGGYLAGPGTGTSDSMLARVSNGEYIVNARATAAYRSTLEHINRAVPAFASGGMVAPVPIAPTPRAPMPNGNAPGDGKLVEVHVTNINQSGEQLDMQTTSTRSGGRLNVETIIRKTVKEGMAKGDYNGALGARYGARTKPTKTG